MKDTISVLNAVYKALNQRALNLESQLSSGGFDCSWGFYNCCGYGEMQEERHYPIPVITVHGLGSLWLEPARLSFVAAYSKANLLFLPLDDLAKEYRFEIFTADEETKTIFSPADEILSVKEKVFSAPAERFCVRVKIPAEQDFNTVREALAKFRIPEELYGG